MGVEQLPELLVAAARFVQLAMPVRFADLGMTYIPGVYDPLG
jgi:hypothetical protein